MIKFYDIMVDVRHLKTAIGSPFGETTSSHNVCLALAQRFDEIRTLKLNQGYPSIEATDDLVQIRLPDYVVDSIGRDVLTALGMDLFESSVSVTDGQTITINSVIVSFDKGAGQNRNRLSKQQELQGATFERRPRNKFMTTTEATAKILERAGLECAGVPVCQALSMLKGSDFFQSKDQRSKMNYVNRFRFSGRFKVTNHELFLRALISGIGSRKSYGHGMIFFSAAMAASSELVTTDNSQEFSIGE